MKKTFLVLLFPLIVATQCEDDDLGSSGFETTYILQNDSNTDLFLLSQDDGFAEIGSESFMSIGSDLNSTTNSILPSESNIFSNVKLYKMEDGDFILAYDQTPIEDDLWLFNEPSVNRFEYTLLITDELID